jgi:hypothetical protein
MVFAGVQGLCAAGTSRTAAQFSSDGDLISGWYWLRDPSFNQVAEWVFEGIPQGTEDLVLDLEVLATSRADGPGGLTPTFSSLTVFLPVESREGSSWEQKRSSSKMFRHLTTRWGTPAGDA